MPAARLGLMVLGAGLGRAEAPDLLREAFELALASAGERSPRPALDTPAAMSRRRACLRRGPGRQ